MNLDEIGEFLREQGFYLLKDDEDLKFMYLDEMKFNARTLSHYCRAKGFDEDSLELITRGDNLVNIALKYLPKKKSCILVEHGCEECAQCSFLQEELL